MDFAHSTSHICEVDSWQFTLVFLRLRAHYILCVPYHIFSVIGKVTSSLFHIFVIFHISLSHMFFARNPCRQVIRLCTLISGLPEARMSASEFGFWVQQHGNLGIWQSNCASLKKTKTFQPTWLSFSSKIGWPRSGRHIAEQDCHSKYLEMLVDCLACLQIECKARHGGLSDTAVAHPCLRRQSVG